MIGDNVLHYEIVEKLGEGGMGIVYKAHQMSLDRPVALKILMNQYASNNDFIVGVAPHSLRAVDVSDLQNLESQLSAGI